MDQVGDAFGNESHRLILQLNNDNSGAEFFLMRMRREKGAQIDYTDGLSAISHGPGKIRIVPFENLQFHKRYNFDNKTEINRISAIAGSDQNVFQCAVTLKRSTSC